MQETHVYLELIQERQSSKRSTMTLVRESRLPGNWPVRFGGGESKKDQQWHLVGFLSYADIAIHMFQ
jgi:hypothetical protein